MAIPERDFWLPETDSITEPKERVAFNAGLLYAMTMIASRIRSELVCCTAEEIAAMAEQLKGGGKAAHWHDICYWGEMGARLAEDPHSLLLSPYECPGAHPGTCWSIRRCRKRGHEICETCFDCTVEGCSDEFCAQDGTCTPIGMELQ